MRVLKRFEEFLKEGVAQKRAPDRQRAASLREDAEKRRSFLKKIQEKVGLSDDDANYYIEMAYDVLIGLIRARLLADGFSSSGAGAHEAEVAYLLNLSFPEAAVRQMDNLRYFRNGILYYGTRFNAEYAQKVLLFLERTYPKFAVR